MMGGPGWISGMLFTITDFAPASNASATRLPLAPALASLVSEKTALRPLVSAMFPGTIVMPAAVAPIQTIDCQNVTTPWVIAAAAAWDACDPSAAVNAAVSGASPADALTAALD